MIELTEQQQQQLREAGWPPHVVNPRTLERFVLIHEDLFERIRAILEEEDEIASVRETYPLVSRALDAEEPEASPEGDA